MGSIGFSLGIFIACYIFVILLCAGIVIIRESSDPAKTVSWLLLIILFPVFGFSCYLIFGHSPGNSKLFRRKQLDKFKLKQRIFNNRQAKDTPFLDNDQGGKKLTQLLLHNSFAPLTGHNSAQVLTNGQAKFSSLLNALEKAKDHIHMEYYIYRDDAIGGEIKRVLLKKSTEGVEVRLLLDGIGSHALAKEFVQSLKSGGVEVEFFFPLRFPYLTSRLNFRNHRKIVVIDGYVGFIGGFNVGDEYLSRDKKLGYWRDTHMRLEGEAVHQVQAAFLDDWYFVTGVNLFEKQYFPDPLKRGDCLIQIMVGGPDSDWKPSLQLFFSLINMARVRIYIESPYFVPDAGTLMALKTAAMSGIDICLIVQGVPDHKITYWASRSYFQELLEAGVRIYAYQKGILHSKVVVVDDSIGVVGSANFDIRSFQIDFEISALVYNHSFAARLEKDFQMDLADSRPIENDEFSKRPLSSKIKESTAKLLAPIL